MRLLRRLTPMLVAGALVSACAGLQPADPASMRGAAGPVAWEVAHVQETKSADGQEVRWDYTLVLKETSGRRIEFERFEFTASWGTGGGTRREEGFRRRLRPHAEVRLEYWARRSSSDGFGGDLAMTVFHRYVGTEDSGKRVTVDIRLALRPGLGKQDTTARLAREAREALQQGRRADATRKARELLARLQSEPADPEMASAFTSLGRLLVDAGEYAAARRLHEQALKIRTEALGPDHPTVADAVNGLGFLLYRARDYPSARALQERALRISEAAFGPDDPIVSLRLDNLAAVLRNSGDYAAARPLYERALRIREAALDADHLDLARSRNNFATLLRLSREPAAAEALYRRALEVRERRLGPGHLDVAVTLHNMALLFDAQQRYPEAEPLYRRALAIREGALGPDHPRVGETLNDLADMLARARRVGEARALYERARRAYLAVARTNVEVDEEARRRLLGGGESGLRGYVRLLADIARGPEVAAKEPASSDAFIVADQARAGATHSALARASARAAPGDARTAELVRQVQDLRNRREALRKQLTEEYARPAARPEGSRLTSLQREVEQLERELSQAAGRLTESFPQFAELDAPEPIDTRSVQRLLRPDEALISLFTLEDRVLVWLVRRAGPILYRDLPIRREELAGRVARLRSSADQSLNPGLSRGELLPFDVAGAHELFTLLLRPVLDDLNGVGHLLIVPDELLLPLPFGVLVTRGDGEAYRALVEAHGRRHPLSADELASYTDLAWLAARYSITVLPSATSLRALRQTPRPAPREGEPFIGFGDPALGGERGPRGGAMVAFRGATVPIAALRGMSRLPATREELLAVAKALGADPGTAVYVGENATKPRLLDLNRGGRLGRARVLAFATHALLAGDLEGLAQPALVLTPPAQPTDEDDGLLSLEDVLGLRLPGTEWVILSACNTAAGDGSGEALAGLARAFFFAGARGLLVSHWSVDDLATRALVTEVFRRYAADPSGSRADALRHAMLTLLRDARGDTAYFAHPFAWAPFFLVGDGQGGAR